jgi:hypothetical protein
MKVVNSPGPPRIQFFFPLLHVFGQMHLYGPFPSVSTAIGRTSLGTQYSAVTHGSYPNLSYSHIFELFGHVFGQTNMYVPIPSVPTDVGRTSPGTLYSPVTHGSYPNLSYLHIFELFGHVF